MSVFRGVNQHSSMVNSLIHHCPWPKLGHCFIDQTSWFCRSEIQPELPQVYLRTLAVSFPYPNLGFAEESVWGICGGVEISKELCIQQLLCKVQKSYWYPPHTPWTIVPWTFVVWSNSLPGPHHPKKKHLFNLGSWAAIAVWRKNWKACSLKLCGLCQFQVFVAFVVWKVY